jgi:hypothetical protein
MATPTSHDASLDTKAQPLCCLATPTEPSAALAAAARAGRPHRTSGVAGVKEALHARGPALVGAAVPPRHTAKKPAIKNGIAELRGATNELPKLGADTPFATPEAAVQKVHATYEGLSGLFE